MSYEIGPFDRVHGYVQFGGSLPGPETWSCGIRVANTEGPLGPTDPDWDMDELLGHYVTCIKAWFQRTQTGIHSKCKLQYVKFNMIGVDGKYQDDATHVDFFTPVGGGGPAEASHPNQICLVVTLLTAAQRGPANKGRFYQPAPSYSINLETGMISVAQALTTAESAKQLIEDMSDVPGIDTVGDPGVVIMSRKAGNPYTRRVNGTKVGRVLDTQRRRRRSMDESYSVVQTVDQGNA